MHSTSSLMGSNPASNTPGLPQEDLYTLRYFWEQKRDLTRWTGFEQALPALQHARPDILAAWHAYLAAEQHMHEVVQADDVTGGAPGTGSIEIVPDACNELIEVRVGGETLGRFSYDEHGSFGMTAAECLVRRLAARLGVPVVERSAEGE